MKQVTIVGMGTGRGTLTREGSEALSRAEVLIGPPQTLALYDGPGKPYRPCSLPGEMAAAVAEEHAAEIAVLVSGDVGFHSATEKLLEALEASRERCRVRLIPGISVVSAFFARVGIAWQEAALVSAHGRELNIVETVRRNRLTFCLTGNNAPELGRALTAAGFGRVKTWVGENLDRDNERVYETIAMELTTRCFAPLTALIFINDDFNDWIPTGLPDGAFGRVDGIPMTKSETRAIVLSKLRLNPRSICYDIGAGTGSVTVEMALHAYCGWVFAIERNEEAAALLRKNCAAFHLGNVTVICAEAPDALKDLPKPDAVFIGGSGGKMAEIVEAVNKKNEKARIVIAAVTVETASLALTALSKAKREPRLLTLNVAHGHKHGGLHVMEALNPVTILWTGGKV